jgi:hypothetical protein
MMQVRVLDHVRLVNGLHLPAEVRGSVVVAIAETEGTVNTLRIDVEGGRATAKPTSEPPDVALTDRTWAAVVLGDLPASRAVAMGLVEATSPGAVRVLDAFAAGPGPFSNEYF